jgi:hypothetical protein
MLEYTWRLAPTIRRAEPDGLHGITVKQALERELRSLQQERPRDPVAEAMVRAKLARLGRK